MKLIAHLLTVLVYVGLMVVPAHAGTPVTHKVASELSSDRIRLSDVFEGVPETLDREVALSPAAGQSVTYDIRVLSHLAKKYRLDWEAKSYADHTLLTRAANFLTIDMVEPYVTDELNKQEFGEDTDFEILFDNRKMSLALPADHAPDFKLINFSFDQRGSRFHAELIAKAEKRAIQQPISGRVIVKRNLPVLAKRLKKGTVIGKHDIAWQWVRQNQLTKDVITNPEDLIGMELRSTLAANSALRSRDVSAPRLIMRGAVVTMKIQTPVMLITAQGKALQDGTKGDIVRIKNMQTNRVIEGTVESDGVVHVHTGTSRVLAAL